MAATLTAPHSLPVARPRHRRGALRACATKNATATESRTAIGSIVEALCRGSLDREDAVTSIHELCEPDHKAMPEAQGVVRFLDGRNTAAVHLAWGLEALSATQRTAAARHVQPEQYAAVRQVLPGVEYHAGAQVLMYTSTQPLPKPARLPGTIAIVSAAPRDNRAADECKIACQLMGAYAFRVQDVHTGNLRHLLDSARNLESADVLVVCSGTDTALPGVLAGMVDVPVIALPALDRDGSTLSTCLTSMTPGVTAVLGGDGVAAAAAAARSLHMAARYFAARLQREAQQPSPASEPSGDERCNRHVANNVSSVNAAFMASRSVVANDAHLAAH